MLCAASGYADLFDLRVWPDPVLAPRNVDEQKAARWRAHWPRLTVNLFL